MTLKGKKEKNKMKTRSNMPLFVVECTDITKLTDGQIDLLHCGDYLVKKTGNQRHAYKVTYKEDKQGICLTYHDASCIETVSYDYTGGHWVYNSTDFTSVAEPLFENLVDNDGHKRFIEDNGTPRTDITGLTSTYCKWSLSGTHLLLVFAGNVANTSTLANGAILCYFGVPKWILDKIYPVWSEYLESKSFQMRAEDWSSQDLAIVLQKGSNDLRLIKTGEITLTADRSFRIAFDLLIDND